MRDRGLQWHQQFRTPVLKPVPMRLPAYSRGAIVAAITATLLIGAMSRAGVLDGLSHALADLRFGQTCRAPTGDLVLVEIDSRSIASIGYWPWSRSVHATIIDQLEALGASDIAFDVDFSSSSTGEGDAALEAALARAGDSVILAAFRQRTHSAASDMVVTHPLSRFLAHAWEASVDVEPDPDGRVRRMARSSDFGTTTLPSMAAMLGHDASQVADSFSIDFGIRADLIDHISVADLLNGAIARSRIAGKAVIVGSSAVELRDFFNVPRFGMVSGPLLQAVAAESLHQHRDLHPAWSGLVPMLLTATFLLGLLVRGRLRLSTTLVLGGLAAAALEACALALQWRYAIIVDTAPVQAQIATLFAIATAAEIEARRVRIVAFRRDTRRLQKTLDRVITDNFAGIVVADANGCVRAVSHAAALLLGRPEIELLGQQILTVLPDPLRSDVAVALAGEHRETAADQKQKHADVEFVSGAQFAIDYVVTVSQLESAEADTAPLPDERAVCLTFLDVTERRKAEARLTYLALYDDLTGLLNRHAFGDRLQRAMLDNLPASMLRVDLDRFRLVNSRVGQARADQLLKDVACTLKHLAPREAAIARLGADEFAILASSADGSAINELGHAVVRGLSEIRIDGYQGAVSASCGAVPLLPEDSEGDTILQRAEAAVRAAKAAGGGRLKIYDALIDSAIEGALALERDMEPALDHGEFEVFYQRQVDARSERIVGVEALLRWKHPTRGYVSPAEFIPVAERTGFIEPLGAWILRTACREVATWPQAVKVAVNLSAVQFAAGDLLDTIADALAVSGLPPERLDVELTETLLMEDDGLTLELLHKIRTIGVGVALDDFGTGYSSLAYLKHFPITKIKMDRSFVRELSKDNVSVAIAEAILTLGRSLGLRTNAEGVETRQQLAILQRLGCDEIQGFLHGRPEPGRIIAEALNNDFCAIGLM